MGKIIQGIFDTSLINKWVILLFEELNITYYQNAQISHYKHRSNSTSKN